MSIEVNKKCPAFRFESTSDEFSALKDFKGANVVIYFYPKDNTPGCTKESEGFRDKYKTFRRANTYIIGISRDSLKSHEKFIDKLGLPFPLIADTDETICNLFDVIKDKNMYGKKVRGIERTTILIDEAGKIRHIWRKVKVDGHVDEVLAAVKAL